MVIKPSALQLKEQVEQLEEEIKSLKSKLIKREEEITKLWIEQEKDKASIKKLTFSNKKLSKIAELETEVNRLEAELQETREELNTVKTEEVQGLQSKLRRTASELGHANSRCKSYEIEITELNRKLKDIMKDLAESDAGRSRQLIEIDTLKDHLEELRAAYAHRKSSIENFSPSFQEYVRLKRQLHKSQQENKDLHQSVEKLSPRKHSEPRLKLLADE